LTLQSHVPRDLAIGPALAYETLHETAVPAVRDRLDLELRRARDVLQVAHRDDRIVERQQHVARHRELRQPVADDRVTAQVGVEAGKLAVLLDHDARHLLDAALGEDRAEIVALRKDALLQAPRLLPLRDE